MTISSAEASSPSPWPLWKRVGFRFLLLYSLLYATGLLLPWRGAAQWFAEAVLHTALPARVAQNGSGDTLESYVTVLLYFFAALALTLIWSALERRNQHLTERLFWPWHTLLRFYLGLWLLSYGWAKIFLGQMPAPDLTDLLTPLGAMSPMGLLWRSVGASPLYQIAGGLAEALAGVLLLSRRTSLPGALLGTGLMGYVFLLNLSYDVPVKLFSGHLLLFCLWLLLPFGPRLWAVLLNRPAAPVVFPAASGRPWLRWAGLVGGGLVVLAVLILPPYQVVSAQRQYGSHSAVTSVAGVYRVISDSRPGDSRWQKVAFGQRERGQTIPFHVLLHNGNQAYGSYTDAAENHTLTLNWPGGLNVFKYLRNTAGDLTLQGNQNGQPFSMILHPDPDATLLITRGFHWISEEPFNR